MSVIWGYNWVIMKESLLYCDPFSFSAIRTFFGALLLFLLLIWKRRSLIPRQVPLTILLGLLSTSASIGLSTWALVATGAGKTAILVYTMPFWVLILAWPILGERLHGLQWVAVAIAFIGLLVILEPWHLQGNPLSSLCAVLSGLSWAASAIVTKIMRQRAEPFDLISITAWQLMFGAVPLVVIALALPSPPIQWTSFLIGSVVYNVVFTNAIAILLWFYSLHELPAGMASMGTLATPVIGVVSAAIRLGEKPSPWEAWGMILILLGLALVSLLGMFQFRKLRKLLEEMNKHQ